MNLTYFNLTLGNVHVILNLSRICICQCVVLLSLLCFIYFQCIFTMNYAVRLILPLRHGFTSIYPLLWRNGTLPEFCFEARCSFCLFPASVANNWASLSVSDLRHTLMKVDVEQVIYWNIDIWNWTIDWIEQLTYWIEQLTYWIEQLLDYNINGKYCFLFVYITCTVIISKLSKAMTCTANLPCCLILMK